MSYPPPPPPQQPMWQMPPPATPPKRRTGVVLTWVAIGVIAALALGGLTVWRALNAINDQNHQHADSAEPKAINIKLGKPVGRVDTRPINTTGFQSLPKSTISWDFGIPTVTNLLKSQTTEYVAKYIWLEVPVTIRLVKGESFYYNPASYIELRDSTGHRTRAFLNVDEASSSDQNVKIGKPLRARVDIDITQPHNDYTLAVVDPGTGAVKGSSRPFSVPFDSFGVPPKAAVSSAPRLPSGAALGDISGDLHGVSVDGKTTQHYRIELGRPKTTDQPQDMLNDFLAPKGRWLIVPFTATFVSASDGDIISAFDTSTNLELRDAKGYRVAPVMSGREEIMTSAGQTVTGDLHFDADPSDGPFTVAFVDTDNHLVKETGPFTIR